MYHGIVVAVYHSDLQSGICLWFTQMSLARYRVTFITSQYRLTLDVLTPIYEQGLTQSRHNQSTREGDVH